MRVTITGSYATPDERVRTSLRDHTRREAPNVFIVSRFAGRDDHVASSVVFSWLLCSDGRSLRRRMSWPWGRECASAQEIRKILAAA